MEAHKNWPKIISIILVFFVFGFLLYRANVPPEGKIVPVVLLFCLALFAYPFAMKSKGAHTKRPQGMQALKYIILLCLTAIPAIPAWIVVLRFEHGGMFAEQAMYISLFAVGFAIFAVLPLMLTYDVCKAREKSLQAMIFPFLFSWFGFLLVWFLMRKKGETEYPFQKIF